MDTSGNNLLEYFNLNVSFPSTDNNRFARKDGLSTLNHVTLFSTLQRKIGLKPAGFARGTGEICL